jgi:hypothetical protein
VIEILEESKLTASELVEMSGGLFSISQACQWMSETKKISKPVMYLLWRVAKDKMEKSSTNEEIKNVDPFINLSGLAEIGKNESMPVEKLIQILRENGYPAKLVIDIL